MNINMKIVPFIILLAFTYLPAKAQNELNNNRKQLFDFNWKFHLGDIPDASNVDFNDNEWRALDLPHDWSIEGQVCPDNPAGNDGGYFPTGIGWYRKTFTAPKAWNNKKISIFFEGVYMNSEVFINGKSIGVYPYGYSSFYYDLTNYIKPGEENLIAVRVDNAKQKNCRWYSGSGIYRHVWIQVKEPVNINHWGVYITTPEVSDKKASVNIQTLVKNETSSSQNISISTIIYNAKGQKKGSKLTSIEIPANSTKDLNQHIVVKSPDLWSTDHPNMYQAHISIKKEDKVLDQTNKSFGIRTIKFTTENGFELNGKKVLINGGCAHSDNGCLGAAAYDRAEERKVELLKAAGFNAVRTSHNIPSEAFLDACDRLGLMVIDEAFDGWKTAKTPHDYSTVFEDWSEKDIASMVLRDRNHPSIIMWSIGNEIIERKEPEAVETAKMLSAFVKKYDTTRPVTSAMTTWDNDWDIFDPLMAAHDVCGYNYQLHRAPDDHKRVPSRVIVQTESYPRDAFANWKLVQDHSYIIGDFVWTAIDYLGESGIGRNYYSGDVPGEHWERQLFPWHGAYCGDIDLLGWRKPISHYRSMLYNDNEKLYMAVREPEPKPFKIIETMWSVYPTWESWTWPGFEGKDIEVEVYSKYPKVRLFLNNKLVGEQATNIETAFKATFKLPYEKGELKAVGIMEDKDVETTILQTAEEATQISLSSDKNEIKADGQSLAYISVELLDKNGVLEPNASNLLNFAIDGPAVIVGVDNANIKDVDPYISNQRKAWKGKAMVVIKSIKGKTGAVKLKVSSEDFEDTYVEIKTY